RSATRLEPRNAWAWTALGYALLRLDRNQEAVEALMTALSLQENPSTRALLRHYATLAGSLDHEPQSSISVILFTNQAYYDASGAPAWSGGAFDILDGRIRVPIGGLTASLTPDMDGTLLHELTHAFVADRTHGVAPRDIQEGLAQYMEGKRCDALLGSDGLHALADGR